MWASLRRMNAARMAFTKPERPLVVVVGATGTGKSQLAVDLAIRFNGEVINGDAMQLYEGLPIITNKIKPAERKSIPHHLLGCIPLSEKPWTVQDFVSYALRTIDDIHARGRLPVLVGGTHYYLQSLLFQHSLATHVKPEGKGMQEVSSEHHTLTDLDAPTEDLLAELKHVDPVMAARWHPNDRRKIRRSVEIFQKTGRRASEFYEQQQQQRGVLPDVDDYSDGPLPIRAGETLRFPTLILWTHTNRDALVTRLDQRVDRMLQDGLLDEVQSLEALRLDLIKKNRAVDKTRGIWVSIGYKEFRDYSERLRHVGSETILADLRDAAIEQTKGATRRYSKSQMQWIRIKLTNALRDLEYRSLFVLETDDLSQWIHSVVRPAEELTRCFLDGEELPDPQEYSESAKELLVPKRNFDMSRRMDLWNTRTCQICSVSAATEEQWKQHLGSRRHRNTLRARSKQQANSNREDVPASKRVGDDAP